MFEEVAAECRRWATRSALEIALVAPLVRGRPEPPVAIEVGDESLVQVSPDRVLRIVLAFGADEFVLAHNHPNGSPPSGSDLALTRRLIAASATVGLALRAHLVVTAEGWWNCLDPELPMAAWSAAAAA